MDKKRLVSFGILFVFLILSINSASAADRYIDTTGSGDGTSFANARAYTNMGTLNIQPGDTVYISGGSAGSSKTYSNFGFIFGSSSNPITYKIGQDSANNGKVIFSGGGDSIFMSSPQNIIISGDAGDGKMHFATTGFSKVIAGSASRTRISYVNFGSITGGDNSRAADFSANAVEIDNCNITLDNSVFNSDALMNVIGTGSSAYDSSLKLHHNTLRVWTKIDAGNTNGGGPDVIKIDNGPGISIYNNFISTFSKSLSGTPEHQDGIQDWTGGPSHQYYKIYNNIFYNLKNAGFVISAYKGAYQHMRMYNNIIIFSDSVASNSNQGGSVAVNSGYYDGSGIGRATLTDVVVANNLIAGGSQSWNLYDDRTSVGKTQDVDFTGSVFANNIVVDGSYFRIGSGSGLTVSGNVQMSASTANASFMTYINKLNGTNNNFRLKSGATSLIDAGTNLYAYNITKDFDGNPRPSSGAWDIGPFVYGASSNINGTCGTPQYNCAQGTSINNTQNTTHYNWQCQGSGTGTNATCSMLIPSMSGVCGSASKNYIINEVFPSGQYCSSSGVAIPSSSTLGNVVGNSVSWLCPGSYGGSAVSCTANRVIQEICFDTSTSFTNNVIPTQNGLFGFEFDATPDAVGVDSLFGLSSFAATGLTDLATIVRFSSTGVIDARNGGIYSAINNINYVSGTKYHFRLIVDLSTHTYDVYVIPNGGSEVLIANNYAFRTEQSGVNNLGFWNIVNEYQSVGNVRYCNIELFNYHPSDLNSNKIIEYNEVSSYMNGFISGSNDLKNTLYVITLRQSGGSYDDTATTSGCSASPWNCWVNV